VRLRGVAAESLLLGNGALTMAGEKKVETGVVQPEIALQGTARRIGKRAGGILQQGDISTAMAVEFVKITTPHRSIVEDTLYAFTEDEDVATELAARAGVRIV
jgi:hypothetical protein